MHMGIGNYVTVYAYRTYVSAWVIMHICLIKYECTLEAMYCMYNYGPQMVTLSIAKHCLVTYQ